MKRIKRYPFFWALAVLIFAGLACNLPGLAQPVEATPVSTSPPRSVEDDLNAAATQMATDGKVTLVLSEAQLTDMIAKDLSSQDNPVFINPVVELRSEQIHFSGSVNEDGLTIPVTTVLTVSATSDGGLQYQVVEAKLGPFPLPESMLNELTTQLDQGLAADLGESLREIFIEEITIRDGEMVITGRKRT